MSDPEEVLRRIAQRTQVTESGCHEWTGPLTSSGYATMRVDGKTQRVHRVSYTLANGEIPAGLVIDHICRNKACVNAEHLRAATVSENAHNRDGANVDSSTGIRGVYPSRYGFTGKRWVNNTIVRTAYFKTPEEAARALDEALKAHANGRRVTKAIRRRLTEDEVIAIRQRLRDGLTQREVAEEFGCGEDSVHLIHVRKTWAHLEESAVLGKEPS